MKKLGFIAMPLMALLLLASCGGGDKPEPQLNRWYTYEDWWNYCSNGNSMSEAATEDIGKEVDVTVNGKDHKVCLIDVDKDVDKNGNKIHTTFEFANLISDSEGYSLATQWNDTNDENTANHDYLNSSIRKALTNEGKGHILWAQKGATKWSTTYKKSVLEMLPSELTDVLAAPRKTVQCYENGEWKDKPIINSKGEYDKLFLLSPEEVGSEDTREGAYTYYQEKDDIELLSLRVKKQTLNEAYTDFANITYDPSSGQTYQSTVYSYAGYNQSVDESEGGYSWLRSPDTYNTNIHASSVSNYGGISSLYVHINVYAVAPAFCI